MLLEKNFLMFFKQQFSEVMYQCPKCLNSATIVMDMGGVYLECDWCDWVSYPAVNTEEILKYHVL